MKYIGLFCALFLFSLSQIVAQTNTFKCNYSQWADRHNDNEAFNQLVDNACKEINDKNYNKGLKVLTEAVAMSAADGDGEPNVFLDAQLRALQFFIDNQPGGGSNNDTVTADNSANNDANKKESDANPSASELPVEETPQVVQNENQQKEAEAPEIVEERTQEPVTTPIVEEEEVVVSEPESTKELETPVEEEEVVVAEPENTREMEIPVEQEQVATPENENTVAEENTMPVADEINVIEEEPMVSEPEEEPTPFVEETPEPEVVDAAADNEAAWVEADGDFEDEDIAFTEEQKEEFRLKGEQKIKQFENYFFQIGNKSTPASISSQAMENAIQLFDSEDRTIQVSSVNRPEKRKFKIRVYLQRVKNLSYDEINVEWADFQYASDFKLGPDGNYYGYVIFSQRFRGVRDNKVVYEDVTKKRQEIVLKFYEKAVQGEMTDNWDVFLGDMSVLQTSEY